MGSEMDATISHTQRRKTALAVCLVGAFIAAVLTLAISPITSAWGPSRSLFTAQSPPGYVTFNSITDDPAYGDERNFMHIEGVTENMDNVTLSIGKEYVVYMYYRNGGAESNIAQGAYARASIPSIVKKGATNTVAAGYIGAQNAQPDEVWDDISFNNPTDGDIALRFVAGSAKLFNHGDTNATRLSDDIIGKGVMLGYNTLNGELPGGIKYAGFVTFRIKADQPNFEISKKVRRHNSTKWKEYLEVNPGDTIDYLIEYKNTGTTKQDGVVIKDKLPQGASYLEGSTRYFNKYNPSPEGAPSTDSLLGLTGINIGDYAPNEKGSVQYSARIIGFEGTVTANAVAETDNGWKDSGVEVIIKDTLGTNGGQDLWSRAISLVGSAVSWLMNIILELAIVAIAIPVVIYLLRKRFPKVDATVKRFLKWRDTRELNLKKDEPDTSRSHRSKP